MSEPMERDVLREALGDRRCTRCGWEPDAAGCLCGPGHVGTPTPPCSCGTAEVEATNPDWQGLHASDCAMFSGDRTDG